MLADRAEAAPWTLEGLLNDIRVGIWSPAGWKTTLARQLAARYDGRSASSI